ncbi:MAG TPA: hypothetical protein VGL09_04325 [Methylomirabilota bacterium]|jgi:hypothetical protein
MSARSRPALVAIDVVAVSASWALAYWLRARRRIPWQSHATLGGFGEYMHLLPVMLLVWIVVFDAFRLYAVDSGSRRRSRRLMAGAVACAAIVLLLSLQRAFPPFGQGMFIYFCVLVIVIASLLRGMLERIAPGLASTGFDNRPPPSLRSQRWPRPSAHLPRLALGVTAALVFNLAWYGWFLSFPMLSEDGAANYSFLLETLRDAGGITRFPIKWMEGLGQPNVFVSVAFDPFSWLFLLGADPGHTMRVSYALRATVAWITAYLFVAALFRRHRALPAVAASLYMLMTFTLAHPWGNRLFAGMFNGTHAAIFPALLFLCWLTARQRRLFGWLDAALAGGVAVFLLAYPIGSLLGLVTLVAFAVAVTLTSPPALRRRALAALVKLGVTTAILLLAPVIGIYHAWSAVAAVAARNVFAEELTTYPPQYVLPQFWHDVPLALRLVVLAAVLVVALTHRWPRPLRTVTAALTVVVGLSQLWTMARASGIAAAVVARLPRPFYMEDYVAVLYATAAAYVLVCAHRVLAPRLRPRSWPLRLAFLATGLAALVGPGVALPAVIATVIRDRAPRGAAKVARSPWLPVTAVVSVFLAAVITFRFWPEQIHPLFAETLLCRERVLWCRDAPGLSMGAAATPITNFLATQLGAGQEFAGRAEFLLRPPVRLAGFSMVQGDAASATAEVVRRWYERAYQEARGVTPPPMPPATAVAMLRELMWNNEVSEDLALTIRGWAESHPEHVRDVRLAAGWGHDAEINVMVQERKRNFAATGNGMLLRALPLQGVPVASSYEQSLDELYYLLWTRYVNAGIPLRHSINFTTLYSLWPERLALIGVRYLVARDVPLRPPLALPVVFRWKAYSVYEIPAPNTAGWGVARLVAATTLSDELRIMRDGAFDPRRTAVAAAADLVPLRGREWTPLATSAVTLAGQSLLFRARAVGGSALAVLPFKFSHCWRQDWRSRPGRILRVDGALLGVAFDDETDVELTWEAGYGPRRQCFVRDAELTPQVKTAAAELE